MATASRMLRHVFHGSGRPFARIHPIFKIPATQPPAIDRGFDKNSMSSTGDMRNFRRFSQTVAELPQGVMFPPRGDRLIEKLREMTVRDQIRWDAVMPPLAKTTGVELRDEERRPSLSVEDARKLLQIAQMESVKSKVKNIGKDSVSYGEFLQFCEECIGRSDPKAAGELAKSLDESGSVIVIGNVVLLHPEQVARALEKAIIPGGGDRRPENYEHQREELAEMEHAKSVIDRKAVKAVRRELWFGLGYLVVQTAAFMRLTFWELSWDVMEPICFYVTSLYFMAGYTFFLRTKRDPSFEGFFSSRFEAKQKKLMNRASFDVNQFNQLRAAFYPSSSFLSDSGSSCCSGCSNFPGTSCRSYS